MPKTTGHSALDVARALCVAPKQKGAAVRVGVPLTVEVEQGVPKAVLGGKEGSVPWRAADALDVRRRMLDKRARKMGAGRAHNTGTLAGAVVTRDGVTWLDWAGMEKLLDGAAVGKAIDPATDELLTGHIQRVVPPAANGRHEVLEVVWTPIYTHATRVIAPGLANDAKLFFATADPSEPSAERARLHNDRLVHSIGRRCAAIVRQIHHTSKGSTPLEVTYMSLWLKLDSAGRIFLLYTSNLRTLDPASPPPPPRPRRRPPLVEPAAVGDSDDAKHETPRQRDARADPAKENAPPQPGRRDVSAYMRGTQRTERARIAGLAKRNTAAEVRRLHSLGRRVGANRAFRNLTEDALDKDRHRRRAESTRLKALDAAMQDRSSSPHGEELAPIAEHTPSP